jgi:hypothetical protein
LSTGQSENLARLTPDEQREVLARLQARQGSYVILATVDEEGREQARAVLRPDAPALPDEWTEHGALQYTLIGNLYNSAVELHEGLPYMVMTGPIRDPQLQIVGILVAQVDLSSLWSVVAAAGSGQSG